MRAERLLSLLMLLQTRTSVTAAEVANELEVSLRTARRDLEALMMSGVPIYSQPGRGGGWKLIGGATTNLTGLSSSEATAMFLAAGPAINQDPALRSGLLKLLSALPEPFRVEAEAASDAIKIDATGWGQLQTTQQPEFLDNLIDAVVRAKQVELAYSDRLGRASRRTVHPLGLVTKRGVWYLVGDTSKGMRTFRVNRIDEVVTSDDPAVRPNGFDLEAEWERVVSEMENQRISITVEAIADARLLRPLRWMFGAQLKVTERRRDGDLLVSIGSQSTRSMAALLVGCGADIRLIDPPTELTAELQRLSRELAATYLSDDPAQDPAVPTK